MRMPWELNAIAKEFEGDGYDVKRAFGGTVVVLLPDGEIHFVPSGIRANQGVWFRPVHEFHAEAHKRPRCDRGLLINPRPTEERLKL